MYSEFQYVCNVLAGVVFIAGMLPYIRQLVRRRIRPMKASWIIWWLLDFLAVVSMYHAGTLNLQLLGGWLASTIVVVLLLTRGQPGWTRDDKLCLLVGVVGGALWATLRNDLAAIVASQAGTSWAAVHTMRNAWHRPQDEDRLTWVLFTISCMLMLIAVPAWTTRNAIQPITWTVIEVTMVAILFVRPRYLQNETTSCA